MKPKPNEVINIALTRLNFGVRSELESRLIDKGLNPKFDAYIKSMSDNMILELSKNIYGKKKISEHTKAVKVPSNWIQHLKKQLKLPHKTSAIEVKFKVEQFALFPELRDNKEVVTYTKIK